MNARRSAASQNRRFVDRSSTSSRSCRSGSLGALALPADVAHRAVLGVDREVNVVGVLGPTAGGFAVRAVQRHVRERIAPDPDPAPALRAPLGRECVVPQVKRQPRTRPGFAPPRPLPIQGIRRRFRPNACRRSEAASSCQRRPCPTTAPISPERTNSESPSRTGADAPRC